jgi:hypothetical protein
MTQTQSTTAESPRTDRTSTSSLDGIRVATQDLHSAISDAAVKHHQASLDKLLKVVPQPAAIIAAVRAVIGAQTEVARKHLTEVVALLEGTEAQIAVSLKTTGQEFHTAIRQALADSRSAVQKVSEVVAATRSAQFKQQNKA